MPPREEIAPKDNAKPVSEEWMGIGLELGRPLCYVTSRTPPQDRTNYCIPLFPEISFVPVRGIDQERTKLLQMYLFKTGLFRLLFRQSSVFLSLNPFAAQETSPLLQATGLFKKRFP